MPLIQGSSEKNIHENIKKLIGEGYKRKQAVAIAYSEAEKAKSKEDQEQSKPYNYKNSCMSAPPKETQQFPYL
ncbi:MAG: hypothetical protein K2P81_17530 [Bacteriovoracaceae bacterium]|nr:hypothetical protein [Bacteriovoracaceae bacterium]